MVQWLGLGAFTAGAWVHSLVGELRSRKPHSEVERKKKKNSEKARNSNGFRHSLTQGLKLYGQVFLLSLSPCLIKH